MPASDKDGKARAAKAAARAAAERREREAANRAADNRREQEAANRAAKAAADRREQEAANRANRVNTTPAKSAPDKAAPTKSAPTKSAPRDPRLMDRYKDAQKRIAKLQPGTEAYDRNYKILQDVGGKYGLKWQQWVPGGVTPPGTTPPEVIPPGAENPAGSALGPPTDTYFNQQPLAKQDELANTGAGQVIYDMAGDVTEFNPGSFESQMDAAYDNVYNRFQRRNQDEFSRQNDEFSQMAANRGLDPNSGAYKTLYKQLADRQDNARQEAMGAATDAAYNVQKQGFDQYRAGQLMPGEVAGQFQGIWAQGQAQRAAAEQARRNFEYQRKLNKMDNDAKLAQQRIASAGGGGGAAGPTAYDNELERQRREGAPGGGGTSPGNDFISGVVSGSGNTLTQGLNKAIVK